MNTASKRSTHWFWNIFIGIAYSILAFIISTMDIKGSNEPEDRPAKWIGDLIHFFQKNNLTWIPVFLLLAFTAYNF